MEMQDWFEKLSPPSGGLEGLRRKLEPREGRFLADRLTPARLAGAAAVILVLGAAGYRFLPLGPPSPPDYGIFQRYMEAPPNEAVSLRETEGSELRLVREPTDNPAVALYWIVEADG